MREASALDATIFNAVFSAPVGATLAWGVFLALPSFPGADLVAATIIAFVLNIPVLIMMALLASSMPRTGGDYVWVSRILSPPLALISNFGAALSAMIGATFWARYFPVFALGPILVTLGVFFNNRTLIDWGNSFQTDNLWIFVGGLAMIVLMTAILIAGTRPRSAGRTRSGSSPRSGRSSPSSSCSSAQGVLRQTTSTRSTRSSAAGRRHSGDRRGQGRGTPTEGARDSSRPCPVFVVMTFMMWNWWSVYLSGELKSASNRGRQMAIMFGALAWDVVFIVLGALLLFKVTGYHFMVAANTAGNAAYAIPTGPGTTSSRRWSTTTVLTFLIVGSFLFWSLPAMVGQHLHADPDRLRLGLRPAAAREVRRGQRADPLAGAGDPAGDGARHR